MSTRLQILAVAGLVLFTGLIVWVERPFRTPPEPDPTRLRDMLGRDPGEPDHSYWGSGRILWTRVKVFFRDWNQPLPTGMYLIPHGDIWTYRFPADSTYHPPNVPLACGESTSLLRDAVLHCRYETQRRGREWRYTLSRTLDEDSVLFVVRISDRHE